MATNEAVSSKKRVSHTGDTNTGIAVIKSGMNSFAYRLKYEPSRIMAWICQWDPINWQPISLQLLPKFQKEPRKSMNCKEEKYYNWKINTRWAKNF